jgi:hypothetical protein
VRVNESHVRHILFPLHIAGCVASKTTVAMKLNAWQPRLTTVLTVRALSFEAWNAWILRARCGHYFSYLKFVFIVNLRLLLQATRKGVG